MAGPLIAASGVCHKRLGKKKTLVYASSAPAELELRAGGVDGAGGQPEVVALLRGAPSSPERGAGELRSLAARTEQDIPGPVFIAVFLPSSRSAAFCSVRPLCPDRPASGKTDLASCHLAVSLITLVTARRVP